MPQTIFGYFPDGIMHCIYHDLKRFRSKRSNAMLYVSEKLNQIIYIRESKSNQGLRIRDLKLYHQRAISDIKRLLKKHYGAKRSISIFNACYILDVLIFKKTYNTVWKPNNYLNKINNENFSEVYNKKTFHLLADLSKSTHNEIAASVFKALHSKTEQYIEKIEKGFSKRNKGLSDQDKVKPFGELKIKLDWLITARNNLQRHYYKLTSERLIPDSLQGQIKVEVNNLQHSSILQPNNHGFTVLEYRGWEVIDKNGLEIV